LHVQPAGAARYAPGDRGARLLERMAGRVRECAPAVAVSGHLAVGAAATVLLEELSDTDLVVVGHHSGPAHVPFGHRIEERVAALHRGPALVVPESAGSPGTGLADRPVVVLADAGRCTPALGFARTEAMLRGCELIVLPAPGDGAGGSAQALLDASQQAAAVVIDRHGADATATLAGQVGRALLREAACPVFLIG
jgi:hypothetical protein